MPEFKYCKYCGTQLPGDTKYCASCGNFVASPQPDQPLSDEGEPPYLEDEIIARIRGIIFPLTRNKLLAGGVLLLFLVIIIAAPTYNRNDVPVPVVSATPTPVTTADPSVKAPSSMPSGQPTEKPTATASPKPSPTEKPTATPTPSPATEEDSTSSQLTQMLKEAGLEAVVPLTKQTNSNGNAYYSGIFSDGKLSYVGGIEVCKSPDDASKRFNTAVTELKGKGYKTLGEANGGWRGYNAALHSTAVLRTHQGADGNQYLIQLQAL